MLLFLLQQVVYGGGNCSPKFSIIFLIVHAVIYVDLFSKHDICCLSFHPPLFLFLRFVSFFSIKVFLGRFSLAKPRVYFCTVQIVNPKEMRIYDL